jgi:hypothetical protein
MFLPVMELTRLAPVVDLSAAGGWPRGCSPPKICQGHYATAKPASRMATKSQMQA